MNNLASLEGQLFLLQGIHLPTAEELQQKQEEQLKGGDTPRNIGYTEEMRQKHQFKIEARIEQIKNQIKIDKTAINRLISFGDTSQCALSYLQGQMPKARKYQMKSQRLAVGAVVPTSGPTCRLV